MKYFWELLAFIGVFVKQRYVVFQLTKRDFQNRYLASYLGLPWAFIQPSVTIFVMWFVFTYGFKVGAADAGIPYAPWLICGMVPWLFISDSVSSSTNSLVEYAYLIKKVFFRASIIPMIKIITALTIHMFFILLIMIFAVGNGYYPTWYWLQLPYYLFATVILVLGIGWFASSVTVFVRDIGQFIGVAMQIMFWATPIFWHHSMLTGKMRYIIYLNPFHYIVSGYRDTFFYHKWFFEQPALSLYFWCVAGVFFIGGAFIFQKLKPHFADVL